MLIELPNIWIIILNCIGIPVAHLSIAICSTRRSSEIFVAENFPYRATRWENKGKIYQTVLRVKSWKHLLPDGSSWLKGFAKSELRSKQPVYLQEFISETCRGEQSHWLQLLVLLPFVIWTPFPASLAIIFYALISNIPCIINLRHTRFRLQAIIQKTRR